ncbi:MAG: C-terminal binding protein [Oscillospiraceae bacterium]|nr:C-terminal binding protein [Oscillospiraceae bacterium]
MAKYKIVFTDDRFGGEHYDEYEFKQLEGIDAEIVMYKDGELNTDEKVIEACKDADAIFLNLVPSFKKAEVIKELKNCKIINRYGVGFDNVNVAACTEMGIQVTYVPDYATEDVSDHSVGLLFACLRQISLRDREIRKGAWNIPSNGVSHRVVGKTLGVVGCGRIAQGLVRKVSGFGLERVLAYDPYIPAEFLAERGIELVELDYLLENSDFISLHMPVTPETPKMIDERALKLMKKDCILINTGRGPLIDDDALVAALKERRIGAAGLDVYWVEPLPNDHPFKELDNVVMTDHAAYDTVEGARELRIKSGINIANMLKGEPLTPAYKVNFK